MKKLSFTAEKDYARTDWFLKAVGVTGTLIKKAKFGGIQINGKAVRTVDPVKAGDSVTVEMQDEATAHLCPVNIPIRILYEDDSVIAVDKPVGMPTHPSKGNSLPTLADAMASHFQDKAFTFRAVNRLDRDTSGIVLLAKDTYAAAFLSRELQSGKVKKEYIARVSGVPNPKVGTVDAPIERESEDAMKRIVRPDGKNAVTEYRVTEIYGDGTSLVRLCPQTGRTHQLRVHMAFIGHPLVGDFLYGKAVEGKTYFLRAVLLSFCHPITKERITVECEAQEEQLKQ